MKQLYSISWLSRGVPTLVLVLIVVIVEGITRFADRCSRTLAASTAATTGSGLAGLGWESLQVGSNRTHPSCSLTVKVYLTLPTTPAVLVQIFLATTTVHVDEPALHVPSVI
jgi:multisubunit Na+/H+ antiporter MnhG subunit